MSQQPTFQITKEHFVGVINSLREQYCKDKEYAADIGRIFNSDGSGFYDNSALINSIFSFLHEVFPKDEDGHSELEHYCYVLNFGRNGEDYENAEDLYDRLMFEKGTIWFETPDKGKLWCHVSDLTPSDKHFIGAKANGSGIIYQIENNQAFINSDRDIHGSFGRALSDICHPIAPEDAFLPTQEMIAESQVVKTHYEMIPGDLVDGKTGKVIAYIGSEAELTEKYNSGFFDKTNPELIDEAGQFPSHSKNGIIITESDNPASYMSFKAYKNLFGKPSPDETA